MKSSLDENKPIFQQIREMIEDDIVNGTLTEEAQVPSTNQLVAAYQINPATVLKGFNQLVDNGILYKKRGVGMFVKSGARSTLIKKRKQAFKESYVRSMLQEARKLGITDGELQEMIKSIGGEIK
ncbi:GntR family transcriptional regulator [Bacillus sp. FSL K6-6483]|uniref:GntR family transcriptional regulator n=1 Tax=Shouchella clausii TaxID=79880 RepID=UPI000BA718D4|nr:GntR family transcriptional regulator [Shouchella clausii]MCM3314435.1 GntR family transcriptional regulator [Psychrobacillus sp. MER TA 17]PAD47757.1 GntR family transcriptional regulator [Shouchella clausii]